MKVLALDTSGDACGVALYDARAGEVLAEERVLIQRGHAEILFEQISRVVQRASIPLKSVDRFAVTTGPGTFTGVRIGLAAARGLALAARKPLIGIGSLEVVACGLDVPASTLVVAAFDARRGEVYAQAFAGDAAITEPVAATPEHAAAALVEASLAAKFLVTGTGAELLFSSLAARGAQVEIASGEPLPRADVLARLAAARTPAVGPVMPLYLRAPDAKLPGTAMTAALELTPLLPSQAELLARLHAEGFEQSWPPEAFTRLLENPARSGALALSSGVPAGFIMIQTTPDEAEVLTLVVSNKERRRGLGRMLLEWSIAGARAAGCAQILLEVAETNQAARALYEQLGFAQIGARSGYYAGSRGPTTALLLSRSVVSPVATR